MQGVAAKLLGSGFVCADVPRRSWYKYEGLRIAKGQALLDWVADNPNLQARTVAACPLPLH